MELQKALKEWAVVVRALREGRQCLLLRKGGIIEKNDAFEVESPAFLLFPTYEHQDASILRPECHGWLSETLSARPAEGHVLIDTYAEVVGAHVVGSPEVLASLKEEYIWTGAYMESRMAFRPANPLFALILRVHRLAAPQAAPVLNEYGGCLSWIDLAEPVSIEGARPALSEEEFRARADRIMGKLRA
ncbi:MAG: DUF1802 family protein [Armatimonadetes bacterium]|nr:DUF1802 family protein [Armatimonadota bacterium]